LALSSITGGQINYWRSDKFFVLQLVLVGHWRIQLRYLFA